MYDVSVSRSLVNLDNPPQHVGPRTRQRTRGEARAAMEARVGQCARGAGQSTYEINERRAPRAWLARSDTPKALDRDEKNRRLTSEACPAPVVRDYVEIDARRIHVRDSRNDGARLKGVAVPFNFGLDDGEATPTARRGAPIQILASLVRRCDRSG